MKALVHGLASGRGRRSQILRIPGETRGADRHDHDLRNRPAHPKGDVPAVTPGRVLGHEGVKAHPRTGTGCTRVGPDSG